MKLYKSDLDEIVNVVDGASVIKIRPGTLRKWAADGRVASLKIGGALRFRVSDLLEMIKVRPKK